MEWNMEGKEEIVAVTAGWHSCTPSILTLLKVGRRRRLYEYASFYM